jgi:hypothetical protein
MVAETDDLPIRLRLTLGPARNASDRGARERRHVRCGEALLRLF